MLYDTSCDHSMYVISVPQMPETLHNQFKAYLFRAYDMRNQVSPLSIALFRMQEKGINQKSNAFEVTLEGGLQDRSWSEALSNTSNPKCSRHGRRASCIESGAEIRQRSEEFRVRLVLTYMAAHQILTSQIKLHTFSLVFLLTILVDDISIILFHWPDISNVVQKSIRMCPPLQKWGNAWQRSVKILTQYRTWHFHFQMFQVRHALLWPLWCRRHSETL